MVFTAMWMLRFTISFNSRKILDLRTAAISGRFLLPFMGAWHRIAPHLRAVWRWQKHQNPPMQLLLKVIKRDPAPEQMRDL